MAFSDTLTVDDAGGDDVSYVLIKRDGTGTTRINSASTAALPDLLNIKHSTTGKGSDAVDRHLVQIITTIAATPEPVTLTLNFTAVVPRNAAVTNAIVIDKVANLVDLIIDGGLATLTGTFVAGLLQGQS